MQTTTLGNTGLSVSRIGLGLAALGRPGYINLGHAQDMGGGYEVADMQARAHAVLDVAWANGVRYFDAARSYGQAEAFLGIWLRDREISPQEVTVGSKWGYTYTADWQVQADKHEVKEHTLPVLQRQWEETQSHLGDYLNLYQIHSATLDSGVLTNTEVLNELARLKATGVTIGLSLSGPAQAQTLHQAMSVQIDGVRLFDVVQATWNLLEPSAGEMLAQAHQEGMGVIIKEALANGRLTERNDSADFANKHTILQTLATANNTTIDALALAYVLQQPWVSVVLSGAAQEDHLRANLQAVECTLDEPTIVHLAALAEPPQTYWQTRSALSWN